MAKKTDVFSCFMHIWIAFTRSRWYDFSFKVKSCLRYKLGQLLLSFFAINYFLCGMCLFGWWGVSTAMHTLSGLLTGSENYLASLEIFETAGSDNRKLCPWNNVYMRALKWRQKHKHYYKCINSFKSMIWCFLGASIRCPSAESSSIRHCTGLQCELLPCNSALTSPLSSQ